jgi:cell division septation protein DedD
MIPIKPTVADNPTNADNRTVADSVTIPDNVAPSAAANTEPIKKRIPLISIPATLSIGLLIAAVYLGGRIVSAHRSATPIASTTTVSTNVPRVEPVQQPHAAPVPAAVAEVKPEVESVAPASTANKANATASDASPAVADTHDANPDDSIPMITPQDGERYIQVGALDPEATRRFVQHLRGEKLAPHVAPGPTPELLRVLIGPFDDHDALDATKAQLQTEGIDSFVRKY